MTELQLKLQNVSVGIIISLNIPYRKQGIPEVMVRAVMSFYEGAKTRVRVGLESSEDFEVEVGVHQGSVLLPLVFAIVVDMVTECEKWFDE